MPDPPDDQANSPNASIDARISDSVTTSKIFQTKSLVDPETIIDESRIVGRDNQLDSVVNTLSPILNDNQPRNALLYGPSGTGKSLITNAVSDRFQIYTDRSDIAFAAVTLNGQSLNTHDQAVYRLAEQLSKHAGMTLDLPRMGVSTTQKLRRLQDLSDSQFDAILFILDEIDQLGGYQRTTEDLPAFDKLLYQLSRLTSNIEFDTAVSIFGITNDPSFMDTIDSRSESSFNPLDIVFSDYDANQLRAILEQRRDAYHDDVLQEEVIPLCSALAAKGNGDARKAIELFKQAGEIAQRKGNTTVTEKHVRDARDDVQQDRVLTQLQSLSPHKQLVVISIAHTIAVTEDAGSIPQPASFVVYQYLCEADDMTPKTIHSYRRYLNEACTYQIASSDKRGAGRGKGVATYISLSHDPETILESLRPDTNHDRAESVARAALRDFTT